jgi:hypothetical protein
MMMMMVDDDRCRRRWPKESGTKANQPTSQIRRKKKKTLMD